MKSVNRNIFITLINVVLKILKRFCTLQVLIPAAMEPVCFRVPRQFEQTIRVEYWELPFFYRPYHFHRECQLSYILNSSGSVYISNSCIPFTKGDVFLLGKNLPHVFRSEDKSSPDNPTNNPARAISVFFDFDQFVGLLGDLPEARSVINLLKSSKHGIKSSLDSGSILEKWVLSLRNAQGFDQVISLIKTLALLADDSSMHYISPNSIPIRDPLDGKRLEQVFSFIQENYQRQIALEDVADQINMTPSAFCRFFKRKTQKTFTNYLIETRIAKACRLLIQKDFTVSETCFESGYNSTSNFHRHFRRITGLSPNEYKRNVLKTD